MLFCLLPLVGNSLFAEITQTESHPPANHEKKRKQNSLTGTTGHGVDENQSL